MTLGMIIDEITSQDNYNDGNVKTTKAIDGICEACGRPTFTDAICACVEHYECGGCKTYVTDAYQDDHGVDRCSKCNAEVFVAGYW